jgi:Arm DNA-binding domain
MGVDATGGRPIRLGCLGAAFLAISIKAHTFLCRKFLTAARTLLRNKAKINLQTDGVPMLTEAKCRAAMPGKRPDGSSEPTLLHDGRGLYLQVSQGKTGINKSWFYRYTIGRTGRSVGLGAYPQVNLVDAR